MGVSKDGGYHKIAYCQLLMCDLGYCCLDPKSGVLRCIVPTSIDLFPSRYLGSGNVFLPPK